MVPGNMQLLPEYHAKLDEKGFLPWYEQHFSNKTYRIYCHWTAGSCGLMFSDYTECYGWDGHQVTEQNNFPDTQAPGYATSDRNSNSAALCIDGFGDASPNGLGAVRCHPEQIRRLVERVAFHCEKQLSPVACVMGHGEAADDVDGYQDPQGTYGPSGKFEGKSYAPDQPWTRWDLDCWVNPANPAQMKAPLEVCPLGWINLMDMIRGEAILLIQEHWSSTHS